MRNEWTGAGLVLLVTAAPAWSDERSPAIRVHVEAWERAGEGVGESVRDVKQVLLEGSKAPRLVDSLLSESDLLIVIHERIRGAPPNAPSQLSPYRNVYTVSAVLIDARRSPQRVFGQGVVWRQAAADLVKNVDLFAREREHVLLRGRADWPVVGLEFEPLTKDLERELGAKGGEVVVTAVVLGGPAAQGGLRVGDTLLKVDGRKVDSAGDLARALYVAARGSEVRLEVAQKGARRMVTLRMP